MFTETDLLTAARRSSHNIIARIPDLPVKELVVQPSVKTIQIIEVENWEIGAAHTSHIV